MKSEERGLQRGSFFRRGRNSTIDTIIYKGENSFPTYDVVRYRTTLGREITNMASPLLLLRRSAATATWSSFSRSSPFAAAISSSSARRPRRDGGIVASAAGRRRCESTTIHLGCLDDDADDDDRDDDTTAPRRTIHSAKSHIARGVGRLTDLVFASGSGSRVRTTCGKTLLDFTSGIGVVNTGHSHPAVVSAARDQLDCIVHSQVNLGYHDKMLELTELLLPNMPRGLDTLYYGTTGAEAVENAVKMARAFTGKHAVVVFRGGYHGRTFGTMAMTVSGAFCRIVPSSWCIVFVSREYPTSRMLADLRTRLFPPRRSIRVRRRRREFTGKQARINIVWRRTSSG
jgi:hypothetical protein